MKYEALIARCEACGVAKVPVIEYRHLVVLDDDDAELLGTNSMESCVRLCVTCLDELRQAAAGKKG